MPKNSESTYIVFPLFHDFTIFTVLLVLMHTNTGESTYHMSRQEIV